MAEGAAQTKKITRHKSKSDEFKVWEVSTKTTLKLHKPLRIVDGIDPDATPRNPDGTAHPIPHALHVWVSKWENDHERAKEAIIRCLPNSELFKLVKDSMTSIVVPPISSTYKPPMTLSCSKRMIKCRWMTTSIDLNSMFMISTTTSLPLRQIWQYLSSIASFWTLTWRIGCPLRNGTRSSMLKASDSSRCRHSSSILKSESMWPETNQRINLPTLPHLKQKLSWRSWLLDSANAYNDTTATSQKAKVRINVNMAKTVEVVDATKSAATEGLDIHTILTNTAGIMIHEVTVQLSAIQPSETGTNQANSKFKSLYQPNFNKPDAPHCQFHWSVIQRFTCLDRPMVTVCYSE